MRSSSLITLTGLLVALSVAAPAFANSVVIEPIKDNTLYETLDGSLSNGAGPSIFAGKTFQPIDNLRRAVLAFDVAGNVPAGAGITGAQLTLNLLLTIDASSRDMSLHRVLEDWGEGTSFAPGGGGAGAPSTPGDATWIHTFFNTAFWSSPGGDYVAPPSATASVGLSGPQDWTGPGMVADVQSWLDHPAVNFGWILIGDEQAVPTARKFGSREAATGVRPVLLVTFDEHTSVDGATWGRIKALLQTR